LLIFKEYYNDDANPLNKNRGKLFLLFAFVFGLGLGNRTELLLFIAGFIWIFYIRRKKLSFTFIISMAVMFTIGFTVFLYLPIRSSAGSFLDWNHPSDLTRFWGSLTRKTHGGTLDLLSTNYASGDNFPATIKFYFNHVFGGFAYLGIFLAVFGLYRLWKKDKNISIALFIAWFLSGPVFIYMANMPPNTHALVILEAHFLLPNIIFVFWIAEGLRYLWELSIDPSKKAAFYLFGTLILAVNLAVHFPDLNKRYNFIAYDYSKNVFRSLPNDSVVVSKKDVQLFLLWDRQLAEKNRLDLCVISQGLSGSFWYIESWRKMHPGLFIGPLNNQADWKYLVENNKREVYFTMEADYSRIDKFLEEPNGLTSRITKEYATKNNADILLNYIYPYRGKYNYTAYREFFSPDIIEDYALGYLYLGQYYLNRKEFEKARDCFKKALAMKPLFPLVLNYTGYTYFEEGKNERAIEEYTVAISQYRTIIKMTYDFNSLPDVREGLTRELSDLYLSLGVCCEKIGKDNECLNAYQSAIDIFPMQAKAHFNKSVIYWKRGDWQQVIKELETALKIDPNYREAAYYLQTAYKKINDNRK
jgi:tetratricopeptide (TPR) repeat protein